MVTGGSHRPGVDADATGDSASPDTTTPGVREVGRFGATERAFHWAFAIPFIGLLLSGLPLSFPVLRLWITGYSPEIGIRLHLVCGVAWLIGPALVVCFGDRKALRTLASDLFAITRDELAWVHQLPRWLAGLACEMRGVGKFNAGQKLNGVFVAITSALFAITGVVLWIVWQSPGLSSTSSAVGGAIVGWSRLLHYLLTILVLAPLLGHIALATVHPRTKESLRGMLFGTVDAEWAREHHPVWYSEICRQHSDFTEDVEANPHSGHLSTTSRKS